MYREQTLADTFRLCYLTLRSSLLQVVDRISSLFSLLLTDFTDCHSKELLSTIEREVTAPNASSLRTISGYLYALKTIGMDLTTRAQLNIANNNSLFNVSRAGRNAESPETIQLDARYTTDFLMKILKGILGAQSLMAHHNIILPSIQLIGALSAWLAKGKYQADSSSPTVEVFGVIGVDCVSYVLNGLNNPLLFYHSALTLRSLCSRCGKLIVQSSDLVDSLIQSWSGLCSGNQTLMREQLRDTIQECGGSGESEVLSFIDDKVDILLEVEKSVVQGICMALKHIPSPEMSRYYIEALMQPPMNLLISSCSQQGGTPENQLNEKDLIAMMTVVNIFVRSIRLSLKERAEPSAVSITSTVIDTSLHPALQILLALDGTLFHSLLQQFPSPLLAEAISHFFLSIVTFISPLLPVTQLSSLVTFCSQHLEELFSSHLTGACELVKEIFSVIGSVVQYQRSKEVIQSTHSEYYCNDEALRVLEDVLVQLLTNTAQFLIPLQCRNFLSSLPFDLFSPLWDESRNSLLETFNSERCDLLLSFLHGVFDHTSCFAQYIPSLNETVTLAVLFISKRCHNASLSLSAGQFLKSIVCLPSYSIPAFFPLSSIFSSRWPLGDGQLS
jgi:hypothetical protein